MIPLRIGDPGWSRRAARGVTEAEVTCVNRPDEGDLRIEANVRAGYLGIIDVRLVKLLRDLGPVGPPLMLIDTNRSAFQAYG